MAFKFEYNNVLSKLNVLSYCTLNTHLDYKLNR